jgi:predicted GNAT family N-acyltransferase
MSVIRLAVAADVDALIDLQLANYPPELHESTECFAGIVSDGCSYVVSSPGQSIIAYLLIHIHHEPTRPVALHSGGSVASNSQQQPAYFLHDLLVSSEHRGSGLAMQLVQHAFSQLSQRTQSLPQLALVSLPSAIKFWQKFGFCAERVSSADERDIMSTYLPGSIFMRLVSE